MWKVCLSLLSLILTKLAELDSVPWCVKPESAGKFPVLWSLLLYLVPSSNWKLRKRSELKLLEKKSSLLSLSFTPPSAWNRFHCVLLTYQVLYLPPTASSWLQCWENWRVSVFYHSSPGILAYGKYTLLHFVTAAQECWLMGNTHGCWWGDWEWGLRGMVLVF